MSRPRLRLVNCQIPALKCHKWAANCTALFGAAATLAGTSIQDILSRGSQNGLTIFTPTTLLSKSPGMPTKRPSGKKTPRNWPICRRTMCCRFPANVPERGRHRVQASGLPSLTARWRLRAKGTAPTQPTSPRLIWSPTTQSYTSLTGYCCFSNRS